MEYTIPPRNFSRSVVTVPVVLIVAALGAGQVPGTPPPVPNGFDIMLQQGGIVDYRTMEEVFDRRRQDQLESQSEATVSRFDLKATAKARRQYNKGLSFLAHKDFQSAVDALTEAIVVYPEFVSAHNALGCAYFFLKENQLARDQFIRAIQLDDHLSGSFLNLGRAELALGHTPAAQVAIEKAFQLAPIDPNLPVILAYVQFLNRDYAAVIRTAESSNGRSRSGTALVHYFAAASWQAKNRPEEASAELEVFLKEDPESAFAGKAREMLVQIKSRQEVSSDIPSSVSFAVRPTDSTSSWVVQKTLQDLKEKQQIAEAELAPSNETNLPDVGKITSGTPEKNKPNGRDGPWLFRTRAEEVAVLFTATDHGKPVTDLRRQDISIKDDNKPPVAVLGFLSQSELPLRMGLLMDTSASINDRFSFEKASAINFLRQVLTSRDDRAFVAGFSSSIVLVRDFTENLNQLADGISQLVPIGGTALWDSVYYAAAKLGQVADQQPVAKVLVLISDGDDNSSNATLEQAIENAERNDVVVYSVSTRNFDPENDSEIPGNRAMRLLAERTGGAVFFPGSAGNLNHSLSELQQVIRSRYLIGYKPAFFSHDGRYRTIHITAQKLGHKLKVNSRKGYYANNMTVQAQF